ncbi:hypothetical protein KM043_001548 [Ampulex compressa]|nr:hypothetical protein KM043_001548 [Ampulex compressa]
MPRDDVERGRSAPFTTSISSTLIRPIFGLGVFQKRGCFARTKRLAGNESRSAPDFPLFDAEGVLRSPYRPILVFTNLYPRSLYSNAQLRSLLPERILELYFDSVAIKGFSGRFCHILWPDDSSSSSEAREGPRREGGPGGGELTRESAIIQSWPRARQSAARHGLARLGAAASLAEPEERASSARRKASGTATRGASSLGMDAKSASASGPAGRSLEPIDCVVFAAMLAVSAVVGVYQAYKSRKSADAVREYLVGGQRMSVFPISMSLIASYISGIAILGLPAEMYVYGTQFWTVIIADSLVSLTMALVYLPVFYGLGITSSYEYLELRFNRAVRLVGSVMFLIKMLLYIPLVIYVPALAFNQVTGIDLHAITPVVCAVCIFYTTLGGLKAVVWTDTIQTFVMFGGVIAVAMLGTARVGGVAEVWRRNLETGRIEFFDFDPDPTVRHTFWTVVCGNYLNWLATCSVNQAMVQRCLSMPNLGRSNATITIMAFGIISIVSLSCYTGIVIFAAFHECDPISTKQIGKSDQLLPFFVMEMARAIPGLAGLFVSGVFSAALSTMSTGLNSMSGVIYEDMIKPCLRRGISDVAASRIMKLTVVLIGVVCVALVFLVEKLGGLIQAGKSLSGITAGPLLGIFSLGMFFPCANSAGALVGGLLSLNLVAWISFGTQAAVADGRIVFPVKPVSLEGCSDELKAYAANLTAEADPRAGGGPPPPFFLYRLSYLWYTWLGFLTAILVGLLVSWLTGSNGHAPADERLYTPFVRRFLRSTPSAKKGGAAAQSHGRAAPAPRPSPRPASRRPSQEGTELAKMSSLESPDA